MTLLPPHVPGGYGFKSRPDIWYYLRTGIFPLAADEKIEPDHLCPINTPKVTEETLISEDNETGVDLKHHWKNRINDTVLCIIVPIDSNYGSGKYRRLGQTFRKKNNE